MPVARRRRALLAEAVRRLDEAGVELEDLEVRRPTLDDVFLSLTGHAAEEAARVRRGRAGRGGGELMAAATIRRAAARRRRGRRQLRWGLADAMVIAKRSLRRSRAAPSCCRSTIQPIMFVLLFRYVFGGAINTPGVSYVDFLIPGIFVQTVAFGGIVTGVGLAEDLQKGLTTGSGRCRWRARPCWPGARSPTS